MPAVPLAVDSLGVNIETEPDNAKFTYKPDLTDSKWNLNEGDNTLELTIESSGATKKIYL